MSTQSTNTDAEIKNLINEGVEDLITTDSYETFSLASGLSPVSNEKSDSEESGLEVLCPQDLLPDSSCWQRSLSTIPYSVPTESGPLFDFLRTVWVNRLLRPTVQKYVREAFARDTLSLAMNIPGVLHALLACSGAEYPVENSTFRRRGELHYNKAVAALRNALIVSDSRRHQLPALQAVLIMCIYERARPWFSHGVEVHLNGAATLIERLYGRDDFAHADVMQCLFMEAFVFHAVTSSLLQPGVFHSAAISRAIKLCDVRLRKHYSSGKRLLASDARSPILGLPSAFFLQLHEISRLYIDRASRNGDTVAHCATLERALDDWEISLATTHQSTFAHLESVAHGYGEISLWTGEFESERTPSLIGPQLYILGCRILLKNILSETQATNFSTENRVDDLVFKAMALIDVVDTSKDYFAEFYCWPFLAVGMSARLPAHRSRLLSKALEFWNRFLCGSMKRIADMLSSLWQDGGSLQIGSCF